MTADSLLRPLACVQPSSHFARAYSEGIAKTKFWEPVYEDSLDLIAKLPGIAALIYTNTYKGGKTISADPKLDWAANLAHMMGAAGQAAALGMLLSSYPALTDST